MSAVDITERRRLIRRTLLDAHRPLAAATIIRLTGLPEKVVRADLIRLVGDGLVVRMRLAGDRLTVRYSAVPPLPGWLGA
jgi:DNA-binding GntR family transcriptional regulator